MLSILEKKYEKDWENIYKNTNKISLASENLMSSHFFLFQMKRG